MSRTSKTWLSDWSSPLVPVSRTTSKPRCAGGKTCPLQVGRWNWFGERKAHRKSEPLMKRSLSCPWLCPTQFALRAGPVSRWYFKPAPPPRRPQSHAPPFAPYAQTLLWRKSALPHKVCIEFATCWIQRHKPDIDHPPLKTVTRDGFVKTIAYATSRRAISTTLAVPVVPSWWITIDAAAFANASASSILPPAASAAARFAVTESPAPTMSIGP